MKQSSSSILILTTDYPSDDRPHVMAYVHARIQSYLKYFEKVKVVSFATAESYIYDGVQVTSSDQVCKLGNYDVIISHAPNLRNHLLFLWPQIKMIKKLVFVIHGHEVMISNELYYKYQFLQKLTDKLYINFSKVYDFIKIRLMGYFIRKYLGQRLNLIFVSQWMKNEFESNIEISKNRIEKYSTVINNPLSTHLNNGEYKRPYNPRLKILTIRHFDLPKYGIDLVIQCAKKNFDCDFHIYGEGKYFDSFNPPANVHLHHQYVTQSEMPNLINQFDLALMPTRLDSQGVTMCEFAAYGIPLVTSDISVCHEMLDQFSNVKFISNNDFQFSVKEIVEQLNKFKGNKEFFSSENTIVKEIKYIQTIISKVSSVN